MRILGLAVAVLAALPASALGDSGTVTFLEGTATRTPAAGGAPVALAVDAEVVEGDTLETGAESKLEIELEDGSIARLDQKSKLVVDSIAKGPETSWKVKLSLVLGQVWAKVTRKVGEDAGFEVHTERAVAGVRGTEFLVSADVEHEVEVYEGTVEVGGRGPKAERWKVGAGKRLAFDREGRAGGLAAARAERKFLKWLRKHETDRKARLDRQGPDRDRKLDRDDLKERRDKRKERFQERREKRKENRLR